MSDETEKHLSFGEVLARTPWLVYELLVTAAFLGLILGYKDFDEPMKLLTRGFIVFAVLDFAVAAAHALAIERRGREKLPWVFAYGFIAMRVGITLSFLWWLHYKSIV